MKNNMRKLYLVLILVFIVQLSGFSQTNEQTSTNRLTLGLNFSPDYCYRTLVSTPSKNFIAHYRDSVESPKFGYTTGLSLLYKFNKRFTFESGLQFSDKGERIKKHDILVDSRWGFPAKEAYVFHYQYIDIPLKANVYLLNKKLKAFVSIGFSVNIFLRDRVYSYLEYSDGTIDETALNGVYDYSLINIAAIGGLGIDYQIKEKINLRFEPIYRRSINPIIDAPIKGYLYSLGANVGVFYKL